MNDLLLKRDLRIPIHVDAASGGFVAPFISPDLEWDFRLELVSRRYGVILLLWIPVPWEVRDLKLSRCPL